LSSASPNERATGLSVLAGVDRDEALQPLLKALDDPEKRVRITAFVHLLWHDPPAGHGERIVAHLGGELRTAERWVQESWPPGAIGSLGLTDRLLPHLEHIARIGSRHKDRRRAAAAVRILRDHPPGWPLTDDSSPRQSA
jgi:HEAT repeat protein